jgi:hypothetical protein
MVMDVDPKPLWEGRKSKSKERHPKKEELPD